MSGVKSFTWCALTLTKSLPFISSTTNDVRVTNVSTLEVAMPRFALIVLRSTVVMFTVIIGEFSMEWLPPVSW